MKEKNNKKEENCNYSNCYNYNKNNKFQEYIELYKNLGEEVEL